MKKSLILTAAIFLFSCLAHAFVTLNDVYCAFTEGSEKPIIEENIVEGAKYFLQSQSTVSLILYEYEKSAQSPLEYTNCLEHVEKAIKELNTSKEKYTNAADIGKRIGYIQQKVGWFKAFDYEIFVSVNKLNNEVAGKVKNYLYNCDIVGLYQRNNQYIEEILETLILIKSDLLESKRPDVKLIWKLLQQYSETALFGNYATIMGGSILSNCEETSKVVL